MKAPTARHRLAQSWKRHKLLYLMMIPGVVWALVFSYGPMFGLYMAFVNYVPKGNFFTTFFQQKFVGLQWFRFFFTTGDFGCIMRNTLMTSLITLAFSFQAPVVLALLLNECRLARFKKFVQTASYLPFFISWVICANIFLTMMSSTGVVNDVLIRLQRVIYITLPCLLPTLAVMFVLAIGGLLGAGFQQQLLMSNSTIINYSDVIDTYAYRYGFGSGMYSYSSAVGLFKSVVNFSSWFPPTSSSARWAAARWCKRKCGICRMLWSKSLVP